MAALIPIDPWLAVAVVVLGLLLTGFLSASEAALNATSRVRLSAQEKAGSRRAAIVLRVLSNRERLSGVLLLGRTLTKTATAAFATYAAAASFGTGAALGAAAGVALLVVILGELAPRMVAVAKPDRTALFLIRPVARLLAVLGPPVRLLQWLARRCIGLFGLRIDSQRPVLATDEVLRDQVDLMRQQGTVEKADGDMVSGLLDLKDLEVADVMIHRTKMRTINLDLGPEAIVREVLASPYTRLPLWREKPENIVGILHAKDLLRALDAAGGEAGRLDVGEIALSPWFVPVTISLPEQLKAFLSRKTHFALAVDEYGEVMGLVTLEDILEEIVGDIRDEHDIALPGLRQQADGSVIVDGSAPIRDLNRAMDWNLPDEAATTIAGLVIHEAQAIPDAGQAFTFHGFRFEVMRKSRNRVTALKIAPVGKIETEQPTS
ncbi:HlyC/CorC family transporter [Bosea sp. (in: a-proteobacteria)]|uniref:HlyC/CorC family transporter n=1 Tax=Bosea sp. (in: a-proteobacteria) TaxID=1871050 RepID=UPI002FC80EA2